MSPMAVPKLKFNELIDEINSLASGDVINEIAVTRCKNEAEKLKQSFPEQAFSALGMIACIEEEYGKMRQYHENAIAITPGNSLLISHYAASLYRAAYYDEAYEYAKKAYEKEPDNISTLAILADVSSALGLKKDNNFYAKELSKVNDDILLGHDCFHEDNPEYMANLFDCLEKSCSNRNKLIKADKNEFKSMLQLAKEIEKAL